MKPTITLAVAAVLSLLLSACAGTPAQSSQSSQSGVTVFGTIDTNISYTR